MYTIHLHSIQLHGRHGVYLLEHTAAAPFEINIAIQLTPNHTVCTLTDTVNYQVVFQILKTEFAKPQQLLEVLATNIITAIKDQYSIAHLVTVSITKLNAPIPTLQGQVGVTVTL